MPDSNGALSPDDLLGFSRYYETLIPCPRPFFTDYRGYITNLITGIAITHVAIITQAKGTVRGNHYHPAQQFIYIISGRLKSLSGRPGGEVQETSTAEAGDILYCPPNVAHGYLALSDVVFLNLDTAPRGRPGVDTHPYPILSAPGLD